MENEQVAVKLTDHELRIKTSEHRIKDLEEQQKQIQELTLSVQKLALSVQSMVDEQKKQAEYIEELRSEPTKEWSTFKRTLATSILSAFGTAIAGGIIYFIATVPR